MLAKVASDVNKPNGQTIVRAEREAVGEFVAATPLRKVLNDEQRRHGGLHADARRDGGAPPLGEADYMQMLERFQANLAVVIISEQKSLATGGAGARAKRHERQALRRGAS